MLSRLSRNPFCFQQLGWQFPLLCRDLFFSSWWGGIFFFLPLLCLFAFSTSLCFLPAPTGFLALAAAQEQLRWAGREHSVANRWGSVCSSSESKPIPSLPSSCAKSDTKFPFPGSRAGKADPFYFVTAHAGCCKREDTQSIPWGKSWATCEF